MIRVALVWLYVLGVGVYAWKDWYFGLCGAILMVAVIQHPDMPKTIAGIQGLNPWNLLFFSVVCSWLRSRRREYLTWDMPGHINVLLLAYLVVVLAATVRLLMNPQGLEQSFASLVSEYIINTIKWPVLGLMLFDGCRSRSRFVLGLVVVLAVYFLLGLQVIRWMPFSSIAAGDDLAERSLKILSNEVGFHRVNLSMMLAGAFWAMWVVSHSKLLPFFPLVFTVVSIITFYAQALTAGRMGYVTWAVLGLVFSLVRWRKYLLAAPVIIPLLIFILMTFMPGAAQRLLQGFSKETVDAERTLGRQNGSLMASQNGPDMYTVTSGRTFAWPFVLEKISESPLVGYGRQSMITTGLYAYLLNTYGESFPHPHNAYLEFLLDNGIPGSLIVLLFYLLILKNGISLFRDQRSPIFMVSGGVAVALTLALLVASFGSQSFYPREGSVGMWCAIGLLFRVYVERERSLFALRQMSPLVGVAPVTSEERQAPEQHGRQPGALLRPRASRKKEPTETSLDGMLWAQAA